MRERTRRPVLLAEDDPNDVKIFKRALRKKRASGFQLEVVTDEEEALDFLQKRGGWSEAWTPIWWFSTCRSSTGGRFSNG